MNDVERIKRSAIVAEALTWERTPYVGHACLKGVGVDCAMLPIAVASAVGLIPTDFSPGYYSQQWMLHRDEEIYVAQILEFAREIDEAEVAPGDLFIWKFGRTYSHSGIVTALEPVEVLHATMAAGAVVRCKIDEEEDYRRRPRRAFSLFTAKGRPVYKGPR